RPSEWRAAPRLAPQTRARAAGTDATLLDGTVARGAAADSQEARLGILLQPALREVISRLQLRRDATRFDRELEVVVDRLRARFASWYEFFPRSQSREPGRHGTFAECIERLGGGGRHGVER